MEITTQFVKSQFVYNHCTLGINAVLAVLGDLERIIFFAAKPWWTTFN